MVSDLMESRVCCIFTTVLGRKWKMDLYRLAFN